jgi:superfamily I DNA/RNA helicase
MPDLMVVADEDQAIYEWRGADPLYIKKFKTDFNPKLLN